MINSILQDRIGKEEVLQILEVFDILNVKNNEKISFLLKVYLLKLDCQKGDSRF